MNDIIEGWVIQRKDGKFFKGVSINKKIFINSIRSAFIYCCENLAKEEIYCSDLNDCKVVKIEIKVVADE